MTTERTLYALFRAMVQTLPGSELDEAGTVSRHHCSPLNPMFKGAWQLSASDPSTIDSSIDETLEWFAERGAPVVFWWCDAESPDDLGTRLEARGLQPFEVGAPVLEAPLDALRAVHAALAGLRIDQVETEEQLQEWKAAFLASFEVPEFAVQAWVDATLQSGLGRTPWRLSVATLAGATVGSAMLFVNGPVAALMQMGVVPGARRQGIGAALQLERVAQARELGCTTAALFASADGYSPYLRLGFRDTGRRLSRYLLLTDGAGTVANRRRVVG
ncbi:MAG: GNAT family N-acetyltransferase [Gaiella sp.]